MGAQKRKQESTQRHTRRVRRRRRFWLRLGVAVLAAVLVATLVQNWDKLSPSTLVPQIGNLFTKGESSGYPVDVSGSPIYQMDTADSCVVLLSDTYVTMLNMQGKEVMRRTHSYTEPLLRTAGKYVLLAESGGKRLQLEMRSKTLFTVNTDYDILTAAVHTNGNVAVVTAAQQGYNARLLVYSVHGDLIYERLCSSLIVDVAFSSGGREVAIATIGAEQGAMRSGIEVLSLSSASEKPLYSYFKRDTMICRLAYLTDAVIAAICDDSVWMYQPKKDTCQQYIFTEGELTAFAIGDKSVAVVTKPYGAASGGTVSYIKTDGTAAFSGNIEGACRDISVVNGTYQVLTDGKLYEVNARGIADVKAVAADGSRVACIGNHVVILGLQVLSQYTV